jgi:hypothetical protein
LSIRFFFQEVTPKIPIDEALSRNYSKVHLVSLVKIKVFLNLMQRLQFQAYIMLFGHRRGSFNNEVNLKFSLSFTK